MRHFIGKTSIISAFLVGASLAQAAAAHVETGSFLNKKCTSTDQLIRQVETDRQVEMRYEQHFHMSKGEIVRMFEHLHPARLENTGAYVVYNYHDDGIIRQRVFKLRRGTWVFMDEAGRAVLKSSCGNPMVAPTPRVVIKMVPGPKEIIKEQLPAPPPQVIVVPAPPVAPPPPAAPMPVPPCPPAPPAPVVGNVNNHYESSVFVLPLLLIINNHSHHEDHHKQPVPEPASMLVIAFGASSLFIRRRKHNAKF